MSKSKNTKRALLYSVLSVVLCTAMLIGSTFAWFTDSVTSGMNKIIAGNLDIELEYMDTAGEWQPVTEETGSLFMPADGEGATLWEPGHTEYVRLRIRNAGSLALKYNFNLNVYGKTGGAEGSFTNANGDEVYLSDFLVFNKIEEFPAAAGREAFWLKEAAAEKEAMGMKALAGFGKKEETLLPGISEEFTLAVYMPTWVGNEANHREIIPAMPPVTSEPIIDNPFIQLGFTMIATQTPYEEDSFGNTYDENVALAATSEELTAAIQNAENGDTIILDSNFKWESQISLPVGKDITLDGNDVTLSTANENQKGLILVNAGAKATIKNFNFAGTAKGVQAINANGDVTVENCSASSGNIAHMVYSGSGANNIVIRNCTSTRPLINLVEKKAECPVLIEGNTLKTSYDVYAITFSGTVSNVTIRNNVNQGLFSAAIVRAKDNVKAYSNVVFEGNTSTKTGAIIKFDPQDTAKAIFDEAFENGAFTGLQLIDGQYYQA